MLQMDSSQAALVCDDQTRGQGTCGSSPRARGTRKLTFDGKFKRLPQDALDALMARVSAGEVSDDDVCRAVFDGWRDVRNEHGEELTYSEENRAILLNTFPVRPSVVKAWFESLRVGKRKN